MASARYLDGLMAQMAQSADDKRDGHAYFLSQGSLDGACGPYCLFMALLICGVLERDAILDLHAGAKDRRTSLGRLLGMIERYAGLFRDGTHVDEIEQMLRKSYGGKLNIDAHDGAGAAVRDFVVREVQANKPVLVGVAFPGGAHWMLAVGVDCLDDNCEDPARLLLLDPGGVKPTVAPWNSMIELTPSRGTHPYYWWTNEVNVRFLYAVSLAPK
ncbi:hypothetical protein LBMAG42_48810 [Deltaproteobacteria bacterium]|nr:hypothetical protein LBMAG42_48810 [Deltaproteobacteria bacterium]